MTLTKNKIVREIGQRTRLKNRDIQLILEALVEVWMEELVSGGRIELENFLIIETRVIDRGKNPGQLGNKTTNYQTPRKIRRLIIRVSRKLRAKLNESDMQ